MWKDKECLGLNAWLLTFSVWEQSGCYIIIVLGETTGFIITKHTAV